MVTGLNEQTASQMGQRIHPTFGYYRQPDGWITVQTITAMERMKRQEKGWTHLGQYGAFDMGPYMANHPFEALFMFGGVAEMPADQVIATGLYLDPPLVPACKQHLTQFHRQHNQACWAGAKRVEFPQLDGVDPAQVGPFPCAFCPRKMATIQAREQHQLVAHKAELESLRTGESMGKSLAEILNRKSETSDEVELARMVAQEQQERIDRLEKLVDVLTFQGQQVETSKPKK